MSNTLLNQNALIESIKGQIESIEHQFILNREKLHDLHIELQQAEELAYQCLEEMEKTKNTPIDKPLKTKIKWVLDVDTYRVAIVTKDGILQVKSVTDGAGDCHIENCNCVPCWEFNNKVPWRVRKPLNIVLFTDEAEWRASLPAGGEIIFSPPELTNRERVRLLSTPLTGENDALKLEELHARFPGKKIIYKMNYDYSAVERGVHEASVNHYAYAYSLLYEQGESRRRAEVQEACGDDVVCTFCWKTPRNGCSEDHGDDMRDWQREVLERD